MRWNAGCASGPWCAVGSVVRVKDGARSSHTWRSGVTCCVAQVSAHCYCNSHYTHTRTHAHTVLCNETSPNGPWEKRCIVHPALKRRSTRALRLSRGCAAAVEALRLARKIALEGRCDSAMRAFALRSVVEMCAHDAVTRVTNSHPALHAHGNVSRTSPCRCDRTFLDEIASTHAGLLGSSGAVLGRLLVCKECVAC